MYFELESKLSATHDYISTTYKVGLFPRVEIVTNYDSVWVLGVHLQIQSNNQPNREEIYTKIVEVLEPMMSKLKDFMKFTVIWIIIISS